MVLVVTVSQPTYYRFTINHLTVQHRTSTGCLSIVTAVALAMTACFSGFEQGPATRPAKPRKAARPTRQPKKNDQKKPQQTYQQAWRLICHAEQLSGAGGADRAARGAHVAQWIVKHLTNKEARYWFINFGRVKEDRHGAFVTEAKKGGQQHCPLAGLLFAPPGSRPAAASRPSSAPAKAR